MDVAPTLLDAVMNDSNSNAGTNDTIVVNCATLEDIIWTDFASIFKLTVFLCLDIMVIAGNTMVIMAVYYTCKLRSVTNLFIVSLAVADLMVGLAVLPFSATRQVYEVWIFGDFLCSVWLAVDVWMCTASILNLCAISLDRYVAVTRPVTYPYIMSMKRAKMLVACVWILSFVICFPPLLGWKDKQNNFSSASSCPWDCELTGDKGYVVYSALGSFYIPMLVMLFFYWNIYRAAAQTTKAINQGFRTTKMPTTRNRFEDNRLTLRIHRGRGSSVRQGNASNSSSTLVTSACNSIENSPVVKSPDTRLRRASTRRNDRNHERIKISVSYPSTDCLTSLINSQSKTNSGVEPLHTRSSSISSSSLSNSGTLYAVHCPYSDTNASVFKSKEQNYHLRVDGGRLSTDNIPPRRCSAGESYLKSRHMSDQMSCTPKQLSPSPSLDDAVNHKPKLIAKMGKRNIKAQVKRFRMETKAAKTLGIIVGGFIFCWLPFFTFYLVRAFCDSCISDITFSVMFWLGYCNSAINPMIYALFSKDFRFAFQRIIYSCFSKKFSLRDSKTSRRGSDGSQLGAGTKRTDRSPSYQEFQMSNLACSNIYNESNGEPPPAYSR